MIDQKDLAIEEELETQMAEFLADPLGFVRYAYPWGEPGPLQNFTGPDKNQIAFLEQVGEEVKRRAFNGRDAVMPLRFVRSSGHGIGKLHPYDLIIDTPTGRVEWGMLQPGDFVFGKNGKPTQIVARHEQGIQPIYRVTFDDGSSTEVGGLHLWNVRGRQERRKGLKEWRTLSTQEILDRGVRRSNGKTTARQWEIPIQEPAEFQTATQPIAPYLMGLWLGDGTKDEPCWTKPFPELTERVRSLGYEVHTHKGGKHQRVQGIVQLLEDPIFSCYSRERYIPECYKFADVEQRKELLRGLLDSDGECFASGSAGYSSASKRLIEDVIWLARSLGGKAQLQPTTKLPKYVWRGVIYDGLPSYKATIQLDWNPFTLEHRRAAWKPSEHRYMTRWIDSIEYVRDAESMCITVEAEDGLYQTNDFIVTHNSVLAAWLVDWIMSTRPDCGGTVTANTIDQLETKTWAQVQRWTKLLVNAHWFGYNSEKLWRIGHKETWFCARATCREENSEAFAGQHRADSTSFYIFDEGSAVPDAIFEVAEGGLTDGEPMEFIFGNPTRSQGKLYRTCFGIEQHRWNHGSIDSRDSAFSNKEQIAEWVEDYGEDSDFVRVRVKGLPPNAADSQFISRDLVMAAQKRQVSVLADEPLIAGCDLSWGGADFNTVRFRRGHDARSIPPIRIPGEQTRDPQVMVMKLAEILTKDYSGRKVAMLFIDSAGICGPVVYRLRQLGHRNIIEVNFGAHSLNEKYAFMRSYMWGQMKEWLAMGAIDRTPQLEEDLTAPGYKITRKVEILLEPKDQIIKRIEHSTDDADALALTFAHSVGPVQQIQPVNRRVSAWG